MHHALKLALVILALVLSACGGGGSSGSEAPEPVTPPPVTEPTPVTLIAGVATPPVDYDWTNPDPELGCVDGAALGAKMAAKSSWAFARPANGNLLFADSGYCDSRYRIRAINPAGNTIKTLAVGAPVGSDDKEALTTFLTPTSLAVAPSGDIYIGDSDIFEMNSNWGTRYTSGRGPGIWKLGTDGNISVLAGVRLPMGRLDGVGATASFKFIEAMCYGSDGLLYVNDSGSLRTVSANGAVTTAATNSGGVVVQSLATCGIDGSVLVRRWFNNSANDDFYDPIVQKSIAKVSVSGLIVSPSSNFLSAYFGPDNPSVLVKGFDPDYYDLIIVNLVDGSSETMAKFPPPYTFVDLTATPPVIDSPFAGVATGGMNFDILTRQSVIRFTRKP